MFKLDEQNRSYNVDIAATSVPINHNMGNYPDAVSCKDFNNNDVEFTIDNTDLDNFTLTFENEFTGIISAVWTFAIIKQDGNIYKLTVNEAVTPPVFKPVLVE